MSTEISALPEECLAHILSLTSPEDVLRSAPVSKRFSSVAISDDVWEKFLPSDYRQIVSQSSDHLEFNSLKDLYFLLCSSHILIDQSTKSFTLDKRSGKTCYMLGSRSLIIAWGDTPQYWSWISVPESRFPENAELRWVCWLDIKGTIPTKSLSQNTTYGAYFVFKLVKEDYTGFEFIPMKVCVSEADEDGLPINRDHHPMVTKLVYLKSLEGSRFSRDPEDLPLPVDREDGWMEIEMGTYQVGSDDNDGAFCKKGLVLEMTLREIERLNGKEGLLIQGIELRPLD